MDDFFTTIVIVALMVLAVVGTIFVFTDHRHFETIKKQCVTQGYIQNETVKIICSVEK